MMRISFKLAIDVRDGRRADFGLAVSPFLLLGMDDRDGWGYGYGD
jgi:hypothetical protein